MKKNLIITGGNSGIGLAAAKELAKQGFNLLIASRNKETLAQAKEEIEAQTPSASVDVYSVDLTDFDAVKAFAEYAKEKMPVLDVLALNAGIYSGAKHQMGASGYEQMISATHLGHFLLVHLLRENLEAAQSARIVITSSLAHRVGRFDINTFTKPEYKILTQIPYLGTLVSYGQSKLANILYTRELDEQLQDSNITVNCFHPGAVDTGLYRYLPKPMAAPNKAMFISPEVAARTLVYLSVSPDVEAVSGKYFYKNRVSSISKAAKSRKLAKLLWQESEQILGLA